MMKLLCAMNTHVKMKNSNVKRILLGEGWLLVGGEGRMEMAKEDEYGQYPCMKIEQCLLKSF
jgi:hypothetical protein